MSEVVEGIVLLGSEMLTWSDADEAVGAFDGRLAPYLLEPASGRVLVAGPTSVNVVRGIADRFDRADVLVRSWLDAQTLRERLPDDIGVFCGPLERMPRPDSGYAEVVALAGLDRLPSAEEDTLPWSTVLADLVRLLGEGGRLHVGVANPVGIDRLLTLPPDEGHRDADWPEGRLAPAPARADEVAASLADDHDLTPGTTWACHGPRSAPLAAATSTALAGHRAESVLLRAVVDAYADGPVATLRDPLDIARELVLAGLGLATAPLTVLEFVRGTTPAGVGAEVLVAERETGDADPLVQRLVRDPSGWRREVLGDVAPSQVAPGVRRDPALLVGPVREGESLADELARCCGQHDVSTAGVLIRRWGDWLAEGSADPVPAERLAPPRLLLDDGTTFHPADPSLVASGPAPRDVVLLRGLLDFAATLLARGSRHPWSAAATPRTIATSLAGAAGVRAGDQDYASAGALDAQLRSGAAPDFERPGGGQLPRSYAELAELADQLAVRAAEGDVHVEWLLRRVQRRQRAFRKASGTLDAVLKSPEYRLGRRILWARGKVKARLERRTAAPEPPEGVWREKPEDDRNEPMEVEAGLIPPGYEPPEGITVVPGESD